MKTEINFCDNEDREYTANISILSWGSPQTYWDPGDPPEWECDSIEDEDGNDIPYWLPVRRWDKLVAWWTKKPVKRRYNPEYSRLEPFVEKAMEDFDWAEAANDEAADQADWEYDQYRDRLLDRDI